MKRALLLLACFVALTVSAADRPNILFLFTDDQRADTIAALGNAHIRTPNLDRLVKEGTTFTRTFCMGSMHGAVCVPSRAMLMTGRTLFRVREQLKEQRTWPEEFAAAGYTTFLTGKWHNGAASVTRCFEQGRAIFLGGMTQQNVEAAPVQDISEAHQLVNQRPAGKIPVETFADSAVAFLASRKAQTKPFLCYVAFNLPHDPRVSPPDHRAAYEAAKPPAPANFLPTHPFNNGALLIRDEHLAPWPRTEEVVRRHLADYYASITFVDAQIGRILEALKAGGHADDTLIVFSSDHGLAIGSHGLFGKQSLYEHSMGAPLILAGPGIPRDERSEAMCYLLDIFPTLGELAGVSAPAGSEGISLAPIIAGRSPSIRDSIFTAYAKTQRALRDDRWKLIVYPEIHKTQLFDLRKDPDEMHDLAAAPAHAGEVKRLTAALREAQQKNGDPLPLAAAKPKSAAFDFSKAAASPKE